jgi:hypothetical protein
MLHVGPYDAEPETVAKMFTFMKERGLVPNGPHHEIYLSGIRKGDPARARTILRYPSRERLKHDIAQGHRIWLGEFSSYAGS